MIKKLESSGLGFRVKVAKEKLGMHREKWACNTQTYQYFIATKISFDTFNEL